MPAFSPHLADVLLVFTTLPDEASAGTLARLLVERQVAACVSKLPSVLSCYRWQGQVEEADEILLLIKTTQVRYAALEAMILEHHPYELPEIVAVPVVAGLPGYLNWVVAETTPVTAAEQTHLSN